MIVRLMLWLALCASCANPASAAVRAWVTPDHVALGESATLNVESDANVGAPDLSALREKFELRGQSSSVQTSFVNGRASTRMIFAVAIEPREAGVIEIPALTVGTEQTAPIRLRVDAAAPATAAHGDDVFIESELATTKPYVQQAVTYTVRLNFAVNLVDGGLDVPSPDDAVLTRVGEDKRYRREINGRPYNVVERVYLLVPEKSGTLNVPPPKFRGVARNDQMDFFDRGRSVSAVGEPRTLDVRAQPEGAPSPWLAAEKLELKRAEPSATARAGEPLMLELSLVAEGATGSQLPELALPAIDGAQVFPEPAQTKDDFADGHPRATRTRRFAVVPSRAGRLAIPEMRVPYWNTKTDRADAAVLAALTLDVAAAVSGVAPAPTAAPATQAAPQASAGSVRAWQAACAALALALVVALIWGWRRGAPIAPRERREPVLPHAPATDIHRALAHGDLRIIARALRESTQPVSATLGALASKLDDPAQRDAVLALDRALWTDSDDASRDQARERLRAAFKRGARTRGGPRREDQPPLPPLYPRR